MPQLSVLIPSRNEPWLKQTIESIRGSIRGDTEIIAVIDGEEAEPKLPEVWPEDSGPRVRIIRNPTPLGQRQSCNLAARASEAEFIIKTDAHSLFDEGFDVKLIADFPSYDTTVIPRMYNLHSHDMVCPHCGERCYNRPPMDRCEKCGSKIALERELVWRPNLKKGPTDWMWFRSYRCKDEPLRVKYWDATTSREFPAQYAAFKKWAKAQGDLAEVMNGQGACWMMHRQRYWDLGGMDENHGGWGQMGVEVACKSWLSGGRQVVNRKTWFAHLFRCGASEGPCWAMSGKQQDAARKYSIRLWSTNAWPGQKRPLLWLVDRFWPVPTWDKPSEAETTFTNGAEPAEPETASNNAPVEVQVASDKRQAEPNHQSSIITHQSKPTLSVLIPARNEEYLVATVSDLLWKLRTDFEILVGWDGDDQGEPPAFQCTEHLKTHQCLKCGAAFTIDQSPVVGYHCDGPDEYNINACPRCGAKEKHWTDICGLDPRVRVIRSAERIGMRPMINKLAREARGEFLMRMDAHCMVDEGIDEKLFAVLRDQNAASTVVAMRYELDAKRWQRRDATDVPYRRLSHPDEDGRGLRSLPWPEYADAHKDEVIGETLSCSGSSWTCRRSTFVDWWGGFDEQHGIFGQEGVEIACMTWLSGGRFLVHKGTWYAHWNRGHAPYALGATVKTQSIERSKWLWVENHWPHARYSFGWLLEKFHPPGWEKEISNLQSQISNVPPSLAATEQRSPCKARKKLKVADLWDQRDLIADPGKRWRLAIFWQAFDEFVRSCLAGNPDWHGQYHQYLVSHLSRTPGYQPSLREIAKVSKTMHDSANLVASIKAEGLKAPLEFYREAGTLILWKGYRRLVVARACGIDRVVGRVFKDRATAGRLSPQAKLTKVFPASPDDLHRLGEQQFAKWGSGATDKYYTHGYTRLYDVYLAPIRRRVKRVLEVGLLNGASLALWREYFPKAHIVGADVEPERWKKFAGNLKSTEVLIGDETDPAFLKKLAAAGPYDLIVDDGSHDPRVQSGVFDALWESVRQYGFYVIEDTFRSYVDSAAGEDSCLPPGFEAAIYDAGDVLAIHHHPNIIFLQKG